MKIKLYLTIFILIASIKSSFSQSQEKQVDSMICWNEDIKLKWSDFLGKSTSSVNNHAITCSKIRVMPIRDSKGFNYIVLCRFNKNCSWVRDTSIVFARALLEHEQLHFDITELIARKIRCKIKEFNRNSKNLDSTEFRDEVQGLMNFWKKIGTLYDEETSHGTIEEKQLEWSNKIKAELKSLNKYKSTSEDCVVSEDL